MDPAHVRCATKAWVLTASLSLAFASRVSAQSTVSGSKTCPASVAAGSTFACTFQLQNDDPLTTQTNLSVTNLYPVQGGTTTAVPCFFGGSPVTTLQRRGTPGDSCTGS